MALNRVACPECGAGLKSASGFEPGQSVCCPKCETYFVVEQPEEADEAEEPKKGKPAAAKAAVGGKKPLKASAAPAEDDADEDQPRKKKKKNADDEEWSYKNSWIRYAVLGVLLVVMGVLGYMLYDKKQRENADQGGNAGRNEPEIPEVFQPPPKMGPVGVGPVGVGPKGPNPKLPNPKLPNPKLPNPKTPAAGGGVLDIFSGPPAPVGAEAEELTRTLKNKLVGTWKATVPYGGSMFTVELVYKADGTLLETKKTPNGSAELGGKWTVKGLVGRKGLLVQRDGFGTTKPEQLIFEDDELLHPLPTFECVGVFRKG